MIIRTFARHSLLLIGALSPLAAQSRGATRLSAQMQDSTNAPLRIDREEAIAEALAHNPTLAVAREQIAQARARVTQGYALPEPSVSANYLGATGAFHPHTGNETDVGVGITIPFPNKIILRGQAAKGDLGNFDELYILQRHLIAAQTAQAYDSLLVALRHREDLLISKTRPRTSSKKPKRATTRGRPRSSTS